MSVKDTIKLGRVVGHTCMSCQCYRAMAHHKRSCDRGRRDRQVLVSEDRAVVVVVDVYGALW